MPSLRQRTLLELIDLYVEQERALPEDAADDESRYGDAILIAENTRHEITRRLGRIYQEGTLGGSIRSLIGDDAREHAPLLRGDRNTRH